MSKTTAQLAPLGDQAFTVHNWLAARYVECSHPIRCEGMPPLAWVHTPTLTGLLEKLELPVVATIEECMRRGWIEDLKNDIVLETPEGEVALHSRRFFAIRADAVGVTPYQELTSVLPRPAAAVPAPQPGAKVGRGKVKGKNIDARMLKALADEPDSCGWTLRTWATVLDCSPSTVAGTNTWKNVLKVAQEMAKASAAERHAGKKPA